MQDRTGTHDEASRRLSVVPLPGVHRIAAIVLNHRTPDLALDCLESVARTLDPARDTIVVVDNASGDGSAERIRTGILERGLQGVTVIESPRNDGFAAGNNVGIRAVEASAYLLLNSDTLVRPGAAELLWEALERDSSRALAAPRLEGLSGDAQISCFRDHSPWSELISSAGTGVVRRLLARWDVPLPVHDEAFSPDWVSFAAVLVSRRAIDRVGLLDEGYFMYFEDADYARRIRAAGMHVWYEPAARVVHLRGRSSPVKRLTAARKRRPRYYYASRSRYFLRARGLSGWIAANLLWTAGRCMSFVREILGDRDRPHVERETLDIWIR